ncbi:MAG: haloacid dehalogenase [Bdellovibrio sp. CG10_big_fil_rev_8_21_14_0_10_47_8]|nr:MAG: haloacid dehalogenase [Bdellovibrio sp. CG10_big_fil_rev_8_21_14_0_10_47_8]
MKKISFESLRGLKKKAGGLSSSELALQFDRYGRNEIVEVVGSPWLELVKDTLKDPMIWFLVGIGTVFVLVNQVSEALVLFVAIFPLILMDAILHWRTQASTTGLRSQLTSEVRVMRDDREQIIDSRDLVPGDLVLVSSGLFLPADGFFDQSMDLQVDESALTGEAFPIVKKTSTVDPFTLVEDGEVFVEPGILGYAGTRVLTGQGHFRVISTGIRTAYGEIVQSVSAMPHERTPLQKSIARLVRALIVGAGLFCLVLAGVRIYQGHGWLDALLSAATLAIAAIPEEFPVVFTFYLGVGVYRLAKRKALVRRAVSVENIGRVSYICSDKTGTITAGKLQLTHLDPEVGSSETELLKASFAAASTHGKDPVDLAIQEAALSRGIKSIHRTQTFPFTEDRKRETVFTSEPGTPGMAYVKGAPEAVFSISMLSSDEVREWKKKTERWAREGHKVLACGRRPLTLTEIDQRIEPVSGFEFCGLIVFEDPPRPEIAEAIAYCQKNDIRVLMITGDHPATASAIAKDVGLGGGQPAVCSAEEASENFQESWLEQNPEFLRGLDVVARCTPMQKLRIVSALKKYGELVAVTGDGVNDVPALKAADIGIAMGERGTRSAKEVSSIILADDNFSTIVNAVKEGRQLFFNLKNSFAYLLLFHIPFVLTAALVPLFGYPLLYLPVHIVWLELIIHPTALFAFQQEASNQNRSPKNEKNFFSKSQAVQIIAAGVGFTLLLAGVFYFDYSAAASIEHARAKILAILIFWSAGLVVYFTGIKSKSAIAIALVTVLSAVPLIQLPGLAEWLRLSPLMSSEWGLAAGSVLAFFLFGKSRQFALSGARKW